MRRLLGPIGLAVAMLAIAGCGDGSRVASGGEAPADAYGRYTASAMVLESPDHGPQLCAWAGLTRRGPPQCGGPDIVGWDWESVTGRRPFHDHQGGAVRRV
jgi:hypothetical protein